MVFWQKRAKNGRKIEIAKKSPKTDLFLVQNGPQSRGVENVDFPCKSAKNRKTVCKCKESDFFDFLLCPWRGKIRVFQKKPIFSGGSRLFGTKNHPPKEVKRVKNGGFLWFFCQNKENHRKTQKFDIFANYWHFIIFDNKL